MTDETQEKHTMDTNIDTRRGDSIQSYEDCFQSTGHFASSIGLSLRREGFSWWLEDAAHQVIWREDASRAVIPNKPEYFTCDCILAQALYDRFATVIRSLPTELFSFEPSEFGSWIWRHPYETLKVKVDCDFPEGLSMSFETAPRGYDDFRLARFDKFPTQHELLQELYAVSEDLSRREKFKIFLEQAAQSWELPERQMGLKIGTVYVGFVRGKMPIRIPAHTGIEEVQRVIRLIEAFERSSPRPIPFSSVI